MEQHESERRSVESESVRPARPQSGPGRNLHPLVEISAEGLAADRRDAEWQDFLHRAKEYRRRLRELDRVH